MKHVFTVFLLFFTIITKAQVGIGTFTPDASAKLEVRSTSKGILIPQVSLTGSSDATTISSPANSLLVYNTTTISNVIPGYYYNSGTNSSPVWLRLITVASGVPYIGATEAVNLGAYDLTVNGLTLGKGAGNNNSTSTASGFQVLSFNTTGYQNTAIGYQALLSNTTGYANIANGYNTLFTNTTGYHNTASGYQALFSNTTGNNNTASGTNAGSNLTTGSNNTFMGNGAQPSAITVINEVTLGDNSITSLRCAATSITALSDRRDKTEIIPIVEGLAFLKQLNPVSFTWNTRDKVKVGIKSSGFIAQELLALQKQSIIGDNLDLVSENNPEKLEARYGNLLPVIVKAIQEESAEKDQKIKELNDRIDSLEKQIKQILKK
jgi:hypothetical protein